MTKITDMVASNKKFSELVQAKIKTFIAANMNPDDAVAAAYTQAKKELTGRDSIARMSREMQFYYLEDGKWVPKIKSFDELKKAVDELNGRPLPTYAHHDDSDYLGDSTGIYYNIVADETTRSIYGETYPAYPKGTMNSIGFTCDDEIGPDGQTYQVNIHLDHVAVSPELIGRGGETVAVIDENDMAPTDPKEAEALKKEVEAKEAALKQKADEIERLKVDTEKQLVEARKAKDAAEAEAKAYKDQVDKIQKDEHDQLLAYCKARQKPGTTVSLDEVKTLDAAKWLKAYTDSLMVPSTADETNIGKSKEKDLLGGDATGDGGLGFPFSDRPKRGTL